MQYGSLQIFSFVLLLIGTGAVVAAIATDFWSYHYSGNLVESWLGLGSQHRGLWRSCAIRSPTLKDALSEILRDVTGEEFVLECGNRLDWELDLWRGEVKMNHREIRVWELGCLALMVASALLGVVALLFAPCCCNRCTCCLAFWAFFAASCCASGVSNYGYHTMAGEARTVDVGDWQEAINVFGWSFWLAVGGGVGQFLAGLGFGLGCCTSSRHFYPHRI